MTAARKLADTDVYFADAGLTTMLGAAHSLSLAKWQRAGQGAGP